MLMVAIGWIDARSRARPSRVQVSDDRGAWKVTPDISLGTSLKDPEETNGGPFTVMRFGWDLGGAIVNAAAESESEQDGRGVRDDPLNCMT